MTGDPGTPERSIIKRDVPEAVARAVLAEAGACHYCGDVLLPRQVEHVRPLSRGGTNDAGNLVAACISCNNQKRTMLVHEWRQWRVAVGMAWPPVASHATDPQHYADNCEECEIAHDDYGGVTPRRMDVVSNGYRGRYTCARGHRWECFWSFDDSVFSDCACSFCVAGRTS